MSEIAVSRFVRVPGSDANVKLPTIEGFPTHHFDRFDIPDLDVSSSASLPMLFFKLTVTEGNPSFGVAINTNPPSGSDDSVPVFKRNLAVGEARSFHEFLDFDVLKKTRNEVVPFCLRADGGSVVVSDFFIMYQARIQLDVSEP